MTPSEILLTLRAATEAVRLSDSMRQARKALISLGGVFAPPDTLLLAGRTIAMPRRRSSARSPAKAKGKARARGR